MYDLKIDGAYMPTPAKDGITEADQLIWSSNAGRTANGNFVGDIIAVKRTITITWNELFYSDYMRIHNAISRVGKPFITVSYVNCCGERKTITGYTEGLSGRIATYTETGRVKDVFLNVVEK